MSRVHTYTEADHAAALRYAEGRGWDATARALAASLPRGEGPLCVPA